MLPSLLLALLVFGAWPVEAQVNSGSNGSDGAFNPQSNITIDMADHPTGIYQYTSVNIPSGVTVTFTPNAKNTPVVWLVQGDCVIGGSVWLGGNIPINGTGGMGGPGGYEGGSAGAGNNPGGIGKGPGGGAGAVGGYNYNLYGGNAAFASLGGVDSYHFTSPSATGSIYGNSFLLPFVGGSGGGGSFGGIGGAGGGGAILIAASQTVTINGSILAQGGNGYNSNGAAGGSGSGGSIRLVTSKVLGTGSLNAAGGSSFPGTYLDSANQGGIGRIRIDAYQNNFGGSITGTFTQGFQPIILPVAGQGVQLAVQSIGGISIGGSPGGVLANPDLIIPAQQSNPLNVVVSCANLPLNTAITVIVHPATGADVTATGTNSTGTQASSTATQASSTATIPINMPRGGGIIYARCVSGLAGVSATGTGSDVKNFAQTGLTTDGETFTKMEIIAGVGTSPKIAYLTESGKRYVMPN